MRPIDWREIMALGLGVIGLASSDFWRMTLPELNAAIAGANGFASMGEPISRQGVDALMARFPDENTKVEM